MSLKDLRTKSENALVGLSPLLASPDQHRRPVTAPGATAMMQPTIDALNKRARAAESKVAELEMRLLDSEATSVQVGLVYPNPWQPRRVFDEAEIRKLADSIAEVGLIQPVILRRVGNPNTRVDVGSVGIPNTGYQLVAGERRLRAHRVLGKADIKSIVIEASDEEMASLALVENIDREDLTAYEIALAIRNAEISFPTRKSLAVCLGINRSDLYSYLAFFSLPPFVVADLEVNPGLLGRDAAKDISAMLKKYGDRAVDVLRPLWARVKTSDLDQGKVAGLIEVSITRSERTHAERDIRKLFVGKEQAGSITRDASMLVIKIKAAALPPEKEVLLRDYIEGLLRQD